MFLALYKNHNIWYNNKVNIHKIDANGGKQCPQEKKQLHTFKGAEHGMSYIIDNEKYESAYNEFVALCLNKKN